MKRIVAILGMAVLIVVMTATICFGAATTPLTVDTYPTDGKTNTTKDNMVVKLYFSNDVGNKQSKAANANTFKITDPDGKVLPTVIMYNPKHANQAMVLVDTTKINTTKDIYDNTVYTFTLSGDFTDNTGNTLGDDVVVSFKTMNQGQSTKVYMGMMIVMFGGMFFFSSRQMKKHAAEEAGEEKEEPFNPYKEAKKTGRPVEEIIAQHEKEMAKKRAKKAKKEARKAAGYDDYEEYTGNYKVKGPRRIADGGSNYITGRKAIAEAKAAEKAKARQAATKKKKKK